VTGCVEVASASTGPAFETAVLMPVACASDMPCVTAPLLVGAGAVVATGLPIFRVT
jgi:hypothetical protein